MTSLPDRIDHYRIVDKLGEGGMGLVYIAEGERLGRRVALKLIRSDATDPHAQARLVQEARIAASIAHPSICQVFDLGEWNGQPFLVMELLTPRSAVSMTRGECWIERSTQAFCVSPPSNTILIWRH